MPTLKALLPHFCGELQDLLATAKRSDLADQLPSLPIVSRCTCGEPNCSHFYTAERPVGSYGLGHSNIVLDPDVGLVVLDLVNDTIVGVEVLDRPDVKGPLDAIFPLPNAKRSRELACPACGFLTVSDSTYGSYNICDLCDWEDDGVQLANPACEGGANRESLIDAQAAALERFPLGVKERDGFTRSPLWRPLNSREIAVARDQRVEKHWKNMALVEPGECYWASRDNPD